MTGTDSTYLDGSTADDLRAACSDPAWGDVSDMVEALKNAKPAVNDNTALGNRNIAVHSKNNVAKGSKIVKLKPKRDHKDPAS